MEHNITQEPPSSELQQVRVALQQDTQQRMEEVTGVLRQKVTRMMQEAGVYLTGVREIVKEVKQSLQIKLIPMGWKAEKRIQRLEGELQRSAYEGQASRVRAASTQEELYQVTADMNRILAE